MKEFYYVHNRGKGNPVKRHETLQSAINEAVRLGIKHHKNFYVLKSVAKYNADGNMLEHKFNEEASLKADIAVLCRVLKAVSPNHDDWLEKYFWEYING